MGREEKTKTDAGELDLRGVPCPLSWAKTKVRLEALPRGATLVLLLDDPRGVRDIPRAAEAEGYAVDGPTGDGAIWRLVIQV
jgi:TusA-related sulfurtransferase